LVCRKNFLVNEVCRIVKKIKNYWYNPSKKKIVIMKKIQYIDLST